MRILRVGDQTVVDIMQQSLLPDRDYRLSPYTFSAAGACGRLLKNMETGMILSLSDAEWSHIAPLKESTEKGTALLGAGLADCVKYGFLVESDTDDYAQYKQLRSLLQMLSAEEPGTKTYTILPTTACNARCVYCYEEGMPVLSMSKETADKVVEFIEKTRWQDTVTLLWFGGEPLAGSKIISRICRGLLEKSIPFRSKIITNATLMSPELLEEAVSDWRLESAQVSVDGLRADYEARKRYVNPAANPYDAMMDAVGRMLEKGIRVTLRCNYDGDNLEGLETFAEEVRTRFAGQDKLSLYPAMLFQAQSRESGIDLYRRIWKLNDRLRELNLAGEKKKQRALRINLCGADSDEKSVVIAPDGQLYHCEHLPGNTSFGSVYDPDPVVCSDERASLEADPTCRSCCFLPECTPFFKNGCADYFANCRAFKEIETAENLRRSMRESEQR
ncbi:MAG: radical SAM protein [Oscillospiraceae bacterium]|nr:radical SAM protein [Oscillospiraceae bacterium]